MSVLQMIKTIILGASCLFGLLAAFLPYWYTLTVQISYDGGRTMLDRTLDVGLYFMDRGSLNMISLLWVERNSNDMTLPSFFKVAEIFFMVGLIGMIVCAAASAIYWLRKYNTATGELCLAGGLFPTAIFMFLGVVFAVLQATVGQNDVWESLPVPGTFMILKAQPDVQMNFGLYIGAAAAVAGIFGAVLAWVQALSLCKHVESIRGQMLYAPLTEEERGVGTEGGVTYGFKPMGKSGFRYDGFSKPEVDF